MGTKGDFGKIAINGYDLTANAQNIGANIKRAANAVQPQNVGVAQFNVGMFDPAFTVNGYRQVPNAYAITAHNLLGAADAGVGSAFDPAMIITALLGNNASPVAGDVAILAYMSLLNYDTGQISPSDVFKFVATFGPRGLRPGIGRLLIDQPAAAAGTITSAFYDRGAAAASGTTLGALAHLQVLTPTGTQATGTITFTTNAADGDTVVINGVTYTFKTTLTPTAGQILLGASSAATALNLYQALIGSQGSKGTAYAAGTTPLALMSVAKPAANVLTLTALVCGTAGNAYTLVKTGTNIAVSGATLASGAAGDSYSVAVQSATSSGGSYTTFLTFNNTMQAGQAAERQEVLATANVTINRYIKVVATTVGSTNKPAFNVACAFNWQQ